MEQQSNQQPHFWYVAKTLSGKEQKAKEYIESAVKKEPMLEKYVFRVLVPTEKVITVRSGKKNVKVVKERILFPGYVMIETAISVPSAAMRKSETITDSMSAEEQKEARDRDKLNKQKIDRYQKFIAVVQNLPNVIDFLRERDKDRSLTPMQPMEVSRILGTMDAQKDNAALLEETFVIGEHVKIIDGAFTSLYGVVQEVNTEKQRLKVEVKIFDRKTPIELSFTDVEKE